MPEAKLPLLEIDELTCHFPVRGFLSRKVGVVRALDGVSFSVTKGETLGIVGESGCGKSTLGKTLAGIHQPTSGSVSFAGETIASPGQKRAASAYTQLQYAYQDPGASLDPRWRLGGSLHEPLVIHTDWSHQQRAEKVREIIAAVGLPQTILDLYPHEVSGGQLRRVGLARILVLGPQLVIFDEPTAGLDASVKATVLSLLRSLQSRFNLTYMFISHDLAVMRSVCDRIAVMYLGRIVENGPADQVIAAPRHPYTRSLIAALPRIGGPRVTEGFSLRGEAPDASNIPSGCRFRTRCPLAIAACSQINPALDYEAGHGVACLRWRETMGPE